MSTLHRNFKRYRLIYLLSMALPALLLSSIFVRLAVAYYQAPRPQATLTLGGSPLRAKFAAQFAQQHASLDVWVSSGRPAEEARPIFRAAGIPASRVHLNYEAVDTVTNFTSMVDDFHRLQIRHVYVITSDYHMRRAKAIATLVFGSQGIAFTPIAIPTEQPSEPWLFALLDSGRALVWILTGYTGASLNAYFSYDQLSDSNFF